METNNYPNWLVSVEQAKRLKELGFDEPCIFSYSEGIGITACIRTGSGDEPNFTDFIIGGNSPGSPLTDLPTYEQVFEWFRKIGLVGWVECQCNPEMEYYTRILKNGENYYRKGKRKSYSSYEEARNILLNELITVYKEFYGTNTNI